MDLKLAVIIPLLIFTLVDLIILINSIRVGEKSSERRYFTLFAVGVFLQQLISALTYSNDFELININNYFILHLIHTLALIFMTLSGYAWFKYFLLTIPNRFKDNLFWRLILLVPIFVIAVTSIVSYWTRWVFYIDANGVYQNGNLYMIQILCPFSYFLCAIITSIVYVFYFKSSQFLKLLYSFALFVTPSLIGVIVQLQVYRGGYSQIGISLALVSLYIERYIQDASELKRIKGLDVINIELEKSKKALEEQINIIQSFSRVFYTSYYIDLKENSFIELSSINNVRDFIGSKGKAQESLNYMATHMIHEEFQNGMLEFNDLSTVDERLEGKRFITYDFIGNSTAWSQAFIIAADKDENGRLKHIFFASRTIHDEKAREFAQNEKILQYQNELEEKVEELRKANIKAEAANDAKTSFLFNMSHDIRTPMNAIIGYTTLLKKQLDNKEKCEDYLNKLEKSNEFLLSLINNVLEMAKIDSGKITLDEEILETGKISKQIQSVYKDMLDEKNIEFTTHFDFKSKYIFGDKLKITEIILNLISNAYKYTNEGGKIEMSLVELPYNKEGWTLIETKVKDNGIGMSKEFIPTIFEKFSRERNATDTKIQGTGLGMPIVKNYVDLMNGTITVESNLYEGSTFTITIPHKIADDSSQIAKNDEAIDYSNLNGKKILLAEDNDLNAEIVIEILKDVGISVERASDGLMCIEMLKNSKRNYYDLILMDIQMPKMNGYEATKLIRKLDDSYMNQIPIIAMTANAFKKDVENALEAGMNGHLAKPIDINKLFKTLAKVLIK